jgi:hypothetical protein
MVVLAAKTPGADQTKVSHMDNADPALVAVLRGKPADEEITQATWWLVADSLRFSVQVRRWAEGVPELSARKLDQVAECARRSAQVALAELGRDLSEPAPHDALVATATIRITMHELARLVVSPRATTAARLRVALEAHLEALDRCCPQTVGTVPAQESFRRAPHMRQTSVIGPS